MITGIVAKCDKMYQRFTNGVELSIDLCLDVTLLSNIDVCAYKFNTHVGKTVKICDDGKVHAVLRKIGFFATMDDFIKKNVEKYTTSQEKIVEILDVTKKTRKETINVEYFRLIGDLLSDFRSQYEVDNICVKTGTEITEVVTTSNQKKEEYDYTVNDAIYSAEKWMETNTEIKKVNGVKKTDESEKTIFTVKLKGTENITTLKVTSKSKILNGDQIFIG